MGGSGRAAEAEASGRLYEVSRPDGADERAARRAASGAFGPGHLHATGPADQLRVPPVVDQVLAAGGTPLDPATRGVMEPRLGHNLADVRIHAGPDAALAARSIQARAFTAGSHVVLGASAPAAASPAGAQLLAHELTHVIQQAYRGGPRLQRAGLDDVLHGGESSASGHPILDEMQLPPDLLIDADALEQAMSEALAATTSTGLPAPSPGDSPAAFTVAGSGSTGYALSFEYQSHSGGPDRTDLLARTYLWTLSKQDEQTVFIELTYTGSGNVATRRITVYNRLGPPGKPVIDIPFVVKAGVPPDSRHETLTRHLSLAEVLAAPQAPEASQEAPVSHVPAAAPPSGQPAGPTARVETVPAPLDDGAWWREFVPQLRGTVGAGLGRALGQVEGVTQELTGMTVDPLLWATSPEAKRSAADSFLDMLPVTVPPTLRTAVEEAAADNGTSPIDAPSGLDILRSALTAAGYTDPYTGAPALTPAVAELGDAIDKDVLQPLFGPPDPDAMLTSRDVGQLEGGLAVQGVLAFTGVEEVEAALKVLGGLGMIKNIADLIARDDAQGKPWLTDPAFITLMVGAVMYAVGLGFSSTKKKLVSNQKLVGAITEWLGATISACPAAIQLSNDLAEPKSASRDEAIKDDILALIKQLAIMLLPIIGMARRGVEDSETTGPARPARRALTDAEKADVLIFGERVRSVLRELEAELGTASGRPPEAYHESVEVLAKVADPPEGTVQQAGVQEAAGRLLGEGRSGGLLKEAADALRSRDRYVQVLMELETRRLEIGQPRTVDGYTRAAASLAGDRGKTVYELYIPTDESVVKMRVFDSGPGGQVLGEETDAGVGLVDTRVFMEQVSGKMFVDNAFEAGLGAHGPLAHLIQYMVLDNYFGRSGRNVDDFFRDLNLVSLALPKDVAPDVLWVGVFDPMLDPHMTQPETIWPFLQPLLDPTRPPLRRLGQPGQ